MDFNEKINLAKKLCEKGLFDFDFSLMYPFTTENISGYIDKFDLENKSLLTVGSSCDQILNSVLKNCVDIDSVDICPFVKYYFYLKKAAIINLEYDDFLKFFCFNDYSLFGRNKKAFKKAVYSKISNHLKEMDNESYIFWNELFSCYKPLRIRRNLFFADEDRASVLKNTNLYLKDDYEYDRLKKLLQNINPRFFTGDISNLKLDRKYDNIWLSNIGQYIGMNKIKRSVDDLFDSLNYDGKILICYLYRFTKSTDYYEEWADIYNLKEVFKLFEEYVIKLESFKGITDFSRNDGEKDSILVLKK